MQKKSIIQLMRALHRDIGYLILGFVLIFSLSGVVLIYRNTEILKHNVTVERKLAPNLKNEEIAGELHLREFKVETEEGDIIYFKNGTYDRSTGLAVYTSKEIIFPFNKFIELHKTSGNNGTHWFTTIFGVLLLFMAVSSFWMYPVKSKKFLRGIILTGIGIVISLAILFF
jgi:hypothetical protein